MIALLEARSAGLLSRAHWLRNIIAGVVAGVVALPLAMAFAIAITSECEVIGLGNRLIYKMPSPRR